MFAACLDGTLDAAAFRYVLLMNDFISSFVWMDMHDFTTFVSIVYPFLNVSISITLFVIKIDVKIHKNRLEWIDVIACAIILAVKHYW